MPSQLYTNVNISFICARNFTYAGKKYKLGQEWDQDAHPGEIDKLVRTRFLYAVVDSTAEKPRHWHHHVHIREDIERKLGVFKDKKDDSLGGSSLYNKPKQLGREQPNITPGAFDEWEETADNAAVLHQKAHEAILKEQEKDEQTEPEELVNPPEIEEEDGSFTLGGEDEEEDLFDPSEHSVPEVNQYLEGDITEEERNRVLAAERLGKGRKGILDG